VARQLGSLLGEVVFVGGQVTELLLTDPTVIRVRYTDDVDVICRVVTRTQYSRVAGRLRAQGFIEDSSEGAPICRWRSPAGILDLMPTEEEVLHFGNRWYEPAYARAVSYVLAGDLTIRIVSAPLFLATKWAAFGGRGEGDYFASRDIEDIVTVVAGRAELVDEIDAEPADVRDWNAYNARELLDSDGADYLFEGILPPARLAPGLAERVTERFRAIAALRPH
jgi:predicted nucleotidyltransferase